MLDEQDRCIGWEEVCPVCGVILELGLCDCAADFWWTEEDRYAED